MGKPTGFMEYQRELPPARDALSRTGDWDEIYLPQEWESLATQSARCMDCGIPFCHAGIQQAAGVIGCPLHNYIPEWNDLLYKGNRAEAARRLSMTNPFPEFTGRVCPALCEGSCTAGSVGEPVTIKNIEKSLGDFLWENQPKPAVPVKRSGKKAAVVGSGPAGLACAHVLNQLGHTVTVYERADRPGGLLMYGIPNMKLDKTIVQRRLEFLQAEGVEIRCGQPVTGENAADITESYDAIILCCGATKPRTLQNVPGVQFKGVRYAVDFLSTATKSLLDTNSGKPDDHLCKGKDVVVLGGGDTGTDCVGTAIRLGCRSVTQLEIMPEAPKNRPDSCPWPYWPKTAKTDYGQEEAIATFGQDPRKYCTTITEITGNEQQEVISVQTVTGKWQDGKFYPLEESRKTRPAGLVLLALGFTGPETEVMAAFGVQRQEHPRYTTNKKHIFMAGDMRRGQSLVVWAIREGMEAAQECHRFLEGQ